MKTIVAWFVRNPVAANLLMFSIIVAGLVSIFTRSTLEIFPEFDVDAITVSVSYRGATPLETEESVVSRIEEAVWDLEGIEEINGRAGEGGGSVTIEVEKGYNARDLLDEVKNRIDSINTFPEDTEKPEIALNQRISFVLNVAVSGDLTERDLRRKAEQVRDELLNIDGITQVSTGGTRPYEIAIEAEEQELLAYNLSLDEIAAAIRRSSLDVPAGSIRTRGGDVLLRTKGQAYTGADFAALVLRTRPDGTRIRVGDVATVTDGFEENEIAVRFNGRPAALVMVARAGDQSAIEVADLAKDYIARANIEPGLEFGIWNDQSEPIQGRLQTLLKSAWQGGLLVFLILGLFLRPSLAFWVVVGLAVAVLGALAILPEVGVTLNLISLFAFILVLGIVVDDAIVTGESIYRELSINGPGPESAINGTNRVAIPVTFGVITTMIAFLPLSMLPGGRGVIFGQIPPVVILVLLFSIIESKFILPAHLSHLNPNKPPRFFKTLQKMQRAVADGLMWFADHIYSPVLQSAVRARYFTLAIFIAGGVLTYGLWAGGRIGWTPFPRIESEVAKASLTMPTGTPFDVTDKYLDRMEKAAMRLQAKYVDADGVSVIKNVLTSAGASGFSSGGPRGSRVRSGTPHRGEVAFQIASPEHRTVDVTTGDLIKEWRGMIGPIPGAESLNFRGEFGRNRDPVDVELLGPDFDSLNAAANDIKLRLAELPDLFDIEDNFEASQEELQLAVKPEAELLGITQSELGRQVRAAFFGVEAQRIQRGRDDVRVMVRYPRERRGSIGDLERMRIRTPDGQEVPFTAVATVVYGTGFNAIERRNRQRIINVTADYDKDTTDAAAINAAIASMVPEVVQNYPGVVFDLEGEQREVRESNEAFFRGLLLILALIYLLLAIAFGSYSQPMVVMSVIPFGLVGAALGHMIMGRPLTMMSIFGMLALSGVVVNDSLVMVDYVNQKRREGMGIMDAIHTAGRVRFRAIILTSLTTFAGLLPLLFEKATHAQFLIYMAISLAFGILFATIITLILIPVIYRVLEDIKWFWGVQQKQVEPQAEQATVLTQ